LLSVTKSISKKQKKRYRISTVCSFSAFVFLHNMRFGFGAKVGKIIIKIAIFAEDNFKWAK